MRFTVLPRRNPPAAFPPPKKASSYRGSVGPQNRIPFKGKPFALPIRYGCFLHGAISSDRHPVHPPAILTGSPVSLIPARSVLPAMSPGSAWEGAQPECFAPDGLGGEMTEGKAAPPSPLRRPAEASKAWNRQWPAMQGIATGRAVAAVSMRKGEPQSSRVLSRRDA